MPLDVALREAAIKANATIAEFNRAMRRTARQIADAFDVPWRLLDIDPLRCEDCRRRFPGPWQASKHRRTAHG